MVRVFPPVPHPPNITEEMAAWYSTQSVSPMAKRGGRASPREKGTLTMLARKADQVTQGRRGTLSLAPLYSMVRVKAMIIIPCPPAAAAILVRA